MGHGTKIVTTVEAVVESGTVVIDGSLLRHDSMRVLLNVTTATGDTPTLNIDIEDTVNATNYATLFSFAEKTTTGVEFVNQITPFGDQLRINYVITGTTPVFTFTITIVAKD